MTAFNRKHEILESLDSLNQVQADQVLEYIKSLLYSQNDAAHLELKKKALREIRTALRQKVKVAF